MQWTTLQLPGTARLWWRRRKPCVRAVGAMCYCAIVLLCRGAVVERKVGATLAALDTFQRSLETILGMA